MNIDFTMQQAFFLWGFILPLMLFGLGHQCYRSLSRIRTASGLKSARLLADLLARRLGEASATFQRVQTELRVAEASLPQYSSDQLARLVDILERATKELQEVSTSTPEWATKITEGLSPAEQTQQALKVGALLLVAATSASFSVWLQHEIIPRLYAGIGAPAAFLIAVAACATLLGSGLVLRARQTVVDGDGTLRTIEGRGALVARLLAAGVVAFLIATGIWVLLTAAIPAGYGLPWAVVVAISAALVALGTELPSMLGLAACGIAAGVSLLEGAAAAVLAWLLRALVGAFIVGEFITGLIAIPAEWVLGPRRSAAEGPAG